MTEQTNTVLRFNDAVEVVEIHGRDIKVFSGRVIDQTDLRCAVQSKIFRDWTVSLDPQIVVDEVTIQGIYYRGPKDPNKVLFIMLVANIRGSIQYSIVLRGPTVAMLPILISGRRKYTVVAAQRRPATGERFCREMLAGMTDGGDIVSAALRELAEESGDLIVIQQHDLIKLGEPSQPSKGILNEPIHFFFAHIHVNKDELASLEGRMTGATDEGEEIILKVCPLDHVMLNAPGDMKTEIAYRRYRERFPKKRFWFF